VSGESRARRRRKDLLICGAFQPGAVNDGYPLSAEVNDARGFQIVERVGKFISVHELSSGLMK
jgi:hypothetical protein